MSRYSPYNTGGAGGSGGLRPCKFFLLGQCAKGSSCTYSHDLDQNLGVFAAMGGYGPAAGLDVNGMGGGSPGVQRTGQYKGALCKFFQQSGTCSAGAACTYAHGHQELAGGYKVRLCKFFEETGMCQKAEACTYAHGVSELLPLSLPDANNAAAAAAAAGVHIAAAHAATAAQVANGALTDPTGTAVFTTDPVAAGSLPPQQALADVAHAAQWSIVPAVPPVPPAPPVLPAPTLPQASVHAMQAVEPSASSSSICKFWEMGQCIKGSACPFSHSPQTAVSSSLVNGVAMQGYGMPLSHIGTEAFSVGGASGSVDCFQQPSMPSSGQRKGALCKYFQQGVTCNAGASCTYAHGIHELAGGYKQRMCKFYEMTGSCTKGDACTYAHGAHELLVGEVAWANSLEALAGTAGVTASAPEPSAPEEPAWAALQMAAATAASPSTTPAEVLVSAGVSSEADCKAGGVCKLWLLGQCTKGASCSYGHSVNSVSADDPQAAAAAAAGLLMGTGSTEIDVASLLSLACAVIPQPGLEVSPPSGPTSYKRALCRYYEQGATCPNGDNCTYAHGIQDLAQGYKRQLCKFFQDNGSCSKGSSCTFAHGPEELHSS